MKIIALLGLIWSISSMAIEPTQFIIVGVSGYKTLRDGKGEPSGAHNNLLDESHPAIYKSEKLYHFSKKKELREIISNFNCRKGKQYNDDLGLIIVANSWGSKNGHKLSKLYKKKCGRLVDYYFLVDGVRKPFGAFTKTPFARQCYNYFQRVSFPVAGKRVRGCKNFEYTNKCREKKRESFDCHISVEWWGTRKVKRLLVDEIL